ncbi:hypothetical protein D3C76_1099120 [compost metagenome]
MSFTCSISARPSPSGRVVCGEYGTLRSSARYRSSTRAMARSSRARRLVDSSARATRLTGLIAAASFRCRATFSPRRLVVSLSQAGLNCGPSSCWRQSGCSLSRNCASLIGSPKFTATWPKRCLSAPMTLKMSKIDSFFLAAPRNSPR